MAKFDTASPESPLPALYTQWMAEFLGAPLPVESRATCTSCPMIHERIPVCKSDVVFHQRTKCCTFMPEIPNFLAGAILNDTSPETAEGRALFERGSLARAIINPLGVFPTPEYSMIYRFNSRGTFGQREGLRCPYYMEETGGLCGIWKYRNGRCSTWFCKHERGTLSVVFWKYMDRLLSEVEKALSRWCLLQVDLGSRALAELIPASGEPVRGVPVIWGKWAGKEREFFVECYKSVLGLKWKDVQDISGPEVHVLARITDDAFRDWQVPQLAPVLRCSDWNSESIGTGRVRVWTFSPFDPIELDAALLDALRAHDGIPLPSALESIKNVSGIEIEPALLQRLFDVRILVHE